MTEEPMHNTPSRRSDTPATVVTLRPPDRRSLPRRAAASLRRWARETFNREQFVSGLKSLLWVAPLTLLVWIYAEREQQKDQTAQFQVEVRSGAAGQVARIWDPAGVQTATVTVVLHGPKARLSEVSDSLRANSPVPILIDGGRQPGYHDVEIQSLLERDPRLRDSNVSITECQPRTLRVEVDTLQEDTLDVKVDPNVRRLLNSDPLFEPPQVKVSAPLAAFQRAKRPLWAQAVLPQDILTPGRHGPVSVRVTVPGLEGSDVTVRQPTVMATVDVGEAEERYPIPSLPVFMVVTAETADAYHVTYTPKFVQSVPVYGSPEKIQQLKAGLLTPKPEARFSITSTEAQAGKGTQRLEYVLPEGLTMRDDDRQTVTFEVTRRDTGQ